MLVVQLHTCLNCLNLIPSDTYVLKTLDSYFDFFASCATVHIWVIEIETSEIRKEKMVELSHTPIESLSKAYRRLAEAWGEAFCP